MANSYVLYNGTGALQTLTVPFGYLDRDHVSVLVDGGSVAFTWLTDTSVQATTTAGTANVKVKRTTPKAPLTVFADGQGLTADDLNVQGLQLQYVSEESEDAYLESELTDLSVDTAKIADLAVTTGKIANLAVTTGKLADGSVTTDKIADANVTTAKIGDNQVTLAKITMNTGKILGRTTASAGAAEEITAGTGLGLASATLTVVALFGRFASTVTNITSAAVPATIDTLHYVTGTSANYDITLPAASSNSGKSIAFTVGSWANANKTYRLDAGVGVEIAGRTRYLTLLHTNVVVLYSDGTRWLPLVLNLDTPWVDGGAMTIGAVTTPPTKGTGTTYDKVYWRRSGAELEARYEYRHTVAGASGSGDYLYSIPVGAIDTTKVTSDSGAGSINIGATSGVGRGVLDAGGTAATSGHLSVSVYDSTRLRLYFISSTGATTTFVTSASFGLANATYRFHAEARLPMTDW